MVLKQCDVSMTEQNLLDRNCLELLWTRAGAACQHCVITEGRNIVDRSILDWGATTVCSATFV